MHKTTFYTLVSLKQKPKEKLGCHNSNVIYTLIGSLLSDGQAEKRKNKTRFHIHAKSRNAEYIFWLHKFFYSRGYCSSNKLKVSKIISKNNTVYYSIKFRTFSFSSLNYLYDAFYDTQKKKIIPTNISSLLTKKAFAIWFINMQEKSGSGVKISTESFTYSQVCLLQKAIFEKFSLKCTIQKHKDKYVLYFVKNDMTAFSDLIKPYLLDCMLYKLNFQ
jgi:hypothetical protein